jgi:uncharacterized protein
MELNAEFIGGLTLDNAAILNRIATELTIRVSQASAVVELTAEGCTVPFISRYRKERTGELDEVQVRDVVHKYGSFVNLETRRIEVIQGIFAQGKLTPELFANINKCSTLTAIEDIYAPYKRKKRTRGMVAIEKGLEPLAEIMLTADGETTRSKAAEFVSQNADNPELSVESVEDALKGAMDIIAERVSQDPENRATVKKLYLRDGSLVVKGLGDEQKKSASTYQMYWDYREPLSSLKPHRVLAVNRGEREGELTVTLEVDEAAAAIRLKDRYHLSNDYHATAIEDALIRLVSPAVLREIRSDASDNADGHGIAVFSENLKNLLMAAPLRGTRVLGIDPGIRTGTKCAAMDETGKFLGYFVIFQESKSEDGKRAIARAIKDHDLQLIAIGNGTGSQEVSKLVAALIAEQKLDVKYTIVDEDGASVYSASDVAREEFPELDLTIRGAISIGRRLQDPLAELVKIDPKSIGVGLYQHDVNQKRLSDSVDEVVESVVNRVGVNINTASHSLLRYVSGINTSLARKIVKYRDEHGAITARDQLKSVSGMGGKSFEQCAGFLKIPESPNILDNTWVHPENYALASEILPVIRSGADISKEQRSALKEKYAAGDTTIEDIVAELRKPNRDPREDYPKPVLQQGFVAFEDLLEGMMVTGKVKNVVDFGAFVDIGIKESALIHVSELSDRFIQDPMDVLKVGDVKQFRIISLDPVRRRIGLSLKSDRRESLSRQPEVRESLLASRPAESAHAPEPANGRGRRTLLVKKPTVMAGDQRATGQPYADDRNRAPVPPAQRGTQDKPSRADDDGMSYNPFAELLKDRQKR